MTSVAYVFPKLPTPKDVIRKIPLKKHVSDDPLTNNVVNGPKHCFNLNDSTFTMFIDECETNSLGKSPS